MDNYTVARDRAQAWFLGFDQTALIEKWNLPHDDRVLRVLFFGRPYGICRKTGVIRREWDDSAADFEETLTLFDLLCHPSGTAGVSGRFAPVNSLRGAAKTGVETCFHSAAADAFDKAPDRFAAACLALGGRPVALGDLAFRFTMFGELDVIVKFYHSDEEFPASVTLLWEENLLQFMLYETVFYAADCLLNMIRTRMDGQV